VPRAREPATGQVAVRWAVNGTLPNGSDLQPLAVPADLRLDLEQQRTLSAFTHAAWAACETREARYFAFFPLDEFGGLWSLSRVTRLERGARGWVLVAWHAVIPREALDSLDWPVHRLLPTAFPAPTVPARGETYAPVMVDLAPARTAATDALRPAIDALKAGLGRKPFRLVLRLAPPLTAEAAVFALWSRLGKRRADLAFCTWSGIESASWPPLDRPFHVVVADADAPVQPRPGRIEHTLGGAPAPRPPMAAEVLSVLDGVDVAPRETPSADPAADTAEVAEALLSAYGEALARSPQAVFPRLAEELAALDDTFAPAKGVLPGVLARAVAAAPATEVDWTGVVALAPPGAASAPLLRLAAGRAWDLPAGRAAFDRLLALGPAEVAPMLDDRDVAPRVRRLALAGLCRARQRPHGDPLGVVLYQRYCLWLSQRGHATLASA
jgi:hypothetical protein